MCLLSAGVYHNGTDDGDEETGESQRVKLLS